MYLNGSNVVTTGSGLVFDGTNFATTGTASATKLIPTGGSATGNGMYLPAANTLAWSNNGAESMRLDSSGNLGIGTSSPSFKLQVAGTQRIQKDGAGYEAAMLSFSTIIETGAIYRLGMATGGNFTIGRSDTSITNITLDASGNLGLGVTPSYPLHISKTTSVYSAYINNTSTNTSDYNVLLLTGASSGMPAMMVGAGGTAVGNAGLQGVGYVGTQNDTPLVFVTNDAARARITSGGDLLVGTTTSSAKLTVESSSLVAKCVRTTAGGIAQFQNGDNAGYGIELLNVAGTSAGSIYWTATTTTYATSSDARLKENISDADSASSLIDAIKVRKFDWKEDGSHQRYGFVAQELLPVAPEAVSTPADDPDGLMGVDYSKLVPMLIKEIQTLRARVAALEQA
jgi:hypothetical protein